MEYINRLMKKVLCMKIFYMYIHLQALFITRRFLRIVQTVDYYVPVDTDSLIHNIKVQLLYNSERCTLDELNSFLLSSIYLVIGILKKNCIKNYIPTLKKIILTLQTRLNLIKKSIFTKKLITIINSILLKKQ